MKERGCQRFGIIFALILMVQYINAESPNYDALRKVFEDYHGGEKNNFQPSLHHRSKRSATVIFNSIMFAAMLASLGADIYFHVEKCCQTVPAACTNKDTYLAKKDKFVNKSISYERDYTEAKNLNENIDLLSGYMKRLWLRTDEFENQITALITSLDGNFSDSIVALEAGIINSQTNYGDFDDVNFAYDSVFKNPISTALRLQGFISWALMERIKMFVSKEIAEAATTLIWTNRGRFPAVETPTTSAFSAFKTRITNSQAVTEIQTWMAANPKTVTFFKNAGYAVFTAGFVAWEAFRIIERINNCKKIKNKSQKAIDKVDAALEDLETYQEELDELKTNLYEYYSSLKAQLTNDDFIAYVENTKSILQNSSDDYVGAASDIEKIDNFLSNINTEDRILTEKITKDLEEVFGHIVYLLACSTKQIDLIKYAKSQCIKGTFSLENILSTTLENQDSFNCTGWITLLQTSKLKETISSLVTSDGYQSSCKLNSESLKAAICSAKKIGQSESELFQKYADSLTSDDVTYLYNLCESLSLTDSQKTDICSRKALDFSLDEVLKTYASFDNDDVTKTYNACELSTTQTEEICSSKTKGDTLEEVQTDFSLYDNDVIETVYNGCELPDLPSMFASFLCSLLETKSREEIMSSSTLTKYNTASVNTALDNC